MNNELYRSRSVVLKLWEHIRANKGTELPDYLIEPVEDEMTALVEMARGFRQEKLANLKEQYRACDERIDHIRELGGVPSTATMNELETIRVEIMREESLTDRDLISSTVWPPLQNSDAAL
jgi:hypothetical protein